MQVRHGLRVCLLTQKTAILSTDALDTQAIEHDSRDPHFLAKLNRLGPVRVDHSIRTYKPVSVSVRGSATSPLRALQAAELAQHVYDTRRQSEIEARSNRASYNHILAASLSDLLDECKSAVSAGDIEKISLRYDIDHARLQSLRALVNNPTIDPATVRRTVNEEGEEKMTMNVRAS